MSNRFEERYQSGDLPWDIARPDRNLIETLDAFEIQPGRAIDIGCGTGDNVFWLMKKGFNAAGMDYSETAIKQAKEKAAARNLFPDLFVSDILTKPIPGGPYQFAFDRGCFHSFSEDEERSNYAKNVHQALSNDGLWLSLIGSVDDGRLEIGPPKRTALQVVTAVESWFEILMLKQSRFESNDEIPSKIWVCLMRKRGNIEKMRYYAEFR